MLQARFPVLTRMARSLAEALQHQHMCIGLMCPAPVTCVMQTCAEPRAADWVDCGWDIPAAAVQHRTLLGIQLCCAADPASATALMPEGSSDSVVRFQCDIGKRTVGLFSGIDISSLLLRCFHSSVSAPQPVAWGHDDCCCKSHVAVE